MNNSDVLNRLLHRLFLDYDIIFYFKTTWKKIQEKMMENVLTACLLPIQGALIRVFVFIKQRVF